MAKLRKLTERYRASTGVEITDADVGDGCFPWHSPDDDDDW